MGYRFKWIKPLDPKPSPPPHLPSSPPPPPPHPLANKTGEKRKRKKWNKTSNSAKKCKPKEPPKPNYVPLTDQLRRFLFSTMNESESFNSKQKLKPSDVFPYLILQERMKHDNESKIILLGGQAKFATSVDSKSGLIRATKFEAVSREALFKFAEDAYKELNKNCPYFCCEPMVRVDIFKTADNKLVVNEFESLSSNFGCANHSDEIVISDYILNFWEAKLREFLYRINRF